MLSFFKRNKPNEQTEKDTQQKVEDTQLNIRDTQENSSQENFKDTQLSSSKEEIKDTQSKPSLFSRLKSSLKRTRVQLGAGLANLFLGKKEIDADLFEQLESLLLAADVGVEATQLILQHLTQAASRKEVKDPAALFQLLRTELEKILAPCEVPLVVPSTTKPFVILMVGVNGVGKTTTIGKLTSYFKARNLSTLLAAGDTFRAAAIEQLKVWGDRHSIPVIAQHTGADSASVIFDAFQSAKVKELDVLIADTAGRLHTKSPLMDELKKINRVLSKIDSTAPHEKLLVLDATTGQNALLQAQTFHDAIGITGLIITKLDGTAKGGILFALAKKLGLPIRFIGVGESAEDLRPFHAKEFVNALFDESEEDDNTRKRS